MNKIKELRIEFRMKQSDLAGILGISQATLSNWETGRFEPDIETLIKLSNLFGVSVDYLAGKTDKKNTSVNQEITEEDIKVALFGGLDDVTDDMWEEARNFAEYIKERERKKRGL